MAEELVNVGNAGGGTSATRSHPRVFVYSLPRALPNGVILRDDAQCEKLLFDKIGAINCLFGDEFKVDLTNSLVHDLRNSTLTLHKVDQFSLGRIMYARLLASPWRVFDPKQADLFFVPIWTADTWANSSTCPSALDINILLPFMRDPKSARRHIMLNPRVAHEHDVCPSWHGDPRPLKSTLVPFATKFALEDRSCCPSVKGNNVHSVPYPSFASGLDLRTKERLRALTNPRLVRPLLVMGAFGIHGAGAATRTIVKAQCREKGTPDCMFMDLPIQQHHGTLAFSAATYERLVSLMLNATFCLEPNGDTPSRKGIIDAIVFGCIPVLFLPAQLKLWPWHLPDWSTFSVLLDPHSDNAVTQLRKIPPAKVALLRQQVARLARGLSYEIHDDMGDVVERSLINAWKLNDGPLFSHVPPPSSFAGQQPNLKAGAAGTGVVSKPMTTKDSLRSSPLLPFAGVLQHVPSVFSTSRSLVIILFVSILCSLMVVAWARPKGLKLWATRREHFEVSYVIIK
eukprot:CAMPEP_0172808808 /NCGR_PEP_ID=MMETSP1075-20121228/7898_1 /TAXON_ID=2916 /ORGANISM="Ceratium fusus, Strain PA161109" /LENGTH=512 /DNA_ID=CAMNT_0013647993 /DNA_START=51 /DNA_END=1589 /DNA_ORIENTATION=-